MKLSEILTDWPEKKQWFYPELAGPNEIEKLIGQAKIDSANDMLTSCDREIDKEALDSALSQAKNVEDFISTMPTWLKPTERK